MNTDLKRLSIGAKLILIIALPIIIVITFISVLINEQVQSIVRYDTEIIAQETAYRYANIVEIELEVALDEARAIADIFEAHFDGDVQLEPKQINGMLKHFIEANPNFLAVYLVLEPQRYQNPTTQDIAGYHSNGQFMPYWTLDNNGQGVVRTLDPHEQVAIADCYQWAKQGKVECIAEPHQQDYQEQTMLTTSLLATLFDANHQFVGVLGIEVALKHLQQVIDKIKISNFDDAYATLFSAQGIMISSPNLTDISQSIHELSQDQTFIDNILDDKAFLMERTDPLLQTAVMTYGAPVKIGHTDIYWLVTINIPKTVFNARTHTVRQWIVTIGFIAVLIIVVIIYAASKKLTQPLKQLVDISDNIAKGHLDNEIPNRHPDELGQLLQASARMQTQLRTRLETDKRIANEALRLNQALDNVHTCVLITANDFHIIYANQAVMRLFKHRQAQIRQQLPEFNAEQLVGQHIDSFHQQSHQQLLEQLNTTYSTTLEIAGLSIDMQVTPIINPAGERLGWVSTFVDRTLEVMTEHEINAVMQAATQGEFTQRLPLDNKSGFFKVFTQRLNQMLDLNLKLINELNQVFTGLSQGDLTQTMNQNYAGLLAQLQHNVNTTVAQLTTLIASVQETTYTVNTAADEISQGNVNLSQRTEQQAASLQQTAASMEQMTSTVQQNTHHAQQASELALNASQQAQRGGEVVHAAMKAMTEISTQSQRVTDIITVIDDIAFQTNLLSLNAAVEAARAGEQGRGFAVVATEVRNLAQRSASAAKEIKALIEDTVNKVNEGSQLVNESGQALEDIVIAVKRASDLIIDIATASREQAEGIEQINKAVAQLDEITQQNSTLVEQAAVASELMKEQAQTLKDQVAFFNTGRPQPQKTLKQPSKKKQAATPAVSKTVDETREWEDF